jgi:hypothetical protein
MSDGELRLAVDPGPRRGAPEWHMTQLVDRLAESADGLLDRAGVPLELLAKREGREAGGGVRRAAQGAAPSMIMRHEVAPCEP